MTDSEIKNLMNEEFIENTYLYCYKRLNNHMDAEDLAQEILLEALTAMRSGKADKLHSFYSWYWKMAHNRYCIFLKKRSGQAISLESIGGNIPSDIKPLDDNLIAKEEILELNYAISRLSKIQREVIVLFYFNEIKVEDIAKRLDISTGTVKRRLFDARQSIKKGVENMADIKMGKLSYAPAELVLWGGNHIPNYWDKISDIMSKQIMVVCRNKGVTVQEIADEIGVAPIYFEEKLNYLVKNKFLKETSNGKYIIDFLIYPGQIHADYSYEHSLVYETENIGKEMTQAVLSAKDEILKLDFYGRDFEYNYLMWILYVYASSVFSNMALKKYNEKWKDKVPENNGKDYLLMGIVRMPGETVNYRETKEISWSNMHWYFTTPNYKNIEYANLFEAPPFPEEEIDSVFKDKRDRMITDKNINTVMKIYDNASVELTATEQEQAAILISDGLISKKDGKLYLNMPVMTRECKNKMHEILRKAVEHLVDKYVTKISEVSEKHLLPYTRDDLLVEYVHYAMSLAFYPVSQVFYYGMYGEKTLAIPEDYSKSAAGLCLCITK